MSEPRLAPRIGAFEVCYKLVNTQSGQQYGPVEVFSKIGCGHWPGAPNIIIKRVQEQLQAFLQKDLGAGMIYQHVRDATHARTQQPHSLHLLFFLSSSADRLSLSLSSTYSPQAKGQVDAEQAEREHKGNAIAGLHQASDLLEAAG